MRTMVFGRPVTAGEVEQLRADDGPTDFVRLCGALIGRVLGERVGSFTLPSITERVDVPDGGVDAEYTAPLSPDLQETGGLVGPGRTVYQFKYRDARAADRRRIVAGLTMALRRDGSGILPQCDRYVFMTNVHLTPVEARRLRDAVVERSPQLAGKVVVVWGAAQIALALNSTPYLRHLFFAERGLCTLDYAERELRESYWGLGWPAFVARDAEVSAIRTFLDDASARVLLVVGPRYVGKTRLVIESLRDRGASVLWASDPTRGADPDLFRDLDSAVVPGILVVDSCDARSVASVAALARMRERVKTIVVAQGPAVGEVGVQRLHVAPLRDQDALRFLTALAPNMSPSDRAWVADRAGGNAGLMMHLVPLVREARMAGLGRPGEVVTRLGDLLEESLLVTLNAEERHALEALSLLSAVGVEGDGEVGREAPAVARALGVQPESLPGRIAALERAGLVRRAGRFVEVIPPVLADHVAAKALARPGLTLAELAQGLPFRTGALLRVLRRLRDLPGRSVQETIGGLLRPGGWFSNAEDVLESIDVLAVLAPAAPRDALACVERTLGGLSVSELRDRLGSRARLMTRWSLVRTLTGLTLRSATFEGAARLLLALAEGDERSMDGAAGAFRSLFHWAHPQVPVGLPVRLRVLEMAVASGTSAGRRRLVATACGEAFDEGVVFALEEIEGPAPPEPPHVPAHAEVRGYAAGVFSLLERLAADPDEGVRRDASAALRTAFPAFVDLALGGDRLDPLGAAAIEALAAAGRQAADAEARASVVSRFELTRRRLAERPAGAAAEAVARIDEVLAALTGSTFEARLWHWVGPPSFGIDEASLEGRDQGPAALDEIAAALAADHGAFERHLSWLTGIEAKQRTPLFQRIGRLDRGDGIHRLLVSAPGGPFWPDAFGAYVKGWFEVEPREAGAALDELAAAQPEIARGVIAATAMLPPSPTAVERLLRVFEGAPEPKAGLAGDLSLLVRWDELDEPDAERLLRAFGAAGPGAQANLLFAFVLRFSRGKELGRPLRELAWGFLESARMVDEAIGRRGAWDRLAAHLGKDEPDRLLALVERKLKAEPGLDEALRDPREQIHRVLAVLEQRVRPAFMGMLLRLLATGDRGAAATRILRRRLVPALDREAILRFAEDAGPSGAAAAVEWLDADAPGFWDVARALLLQFGDDEGVRAALSGCLWSGTWWGSRVPSFERRLQEARRLKADPDPRVQSWAIEAEEHLRQFLDQVTGEEQERWIWDHRVSRNQLRGMLEKKDSPERLWAIRRLLQDAPADRVKELLTPQEIADALPKVADLDARKRQMWDAYARLLGDPEH